MFSSMSASYDSRNGSQSLVRISSKQAPAVEGCKQPLARLNSSHLVCRDKITSKNKDVMVQRSKIREPLVENTISRSHGGSTSSQQLVGKNRSHASGLRAPIRLSKEQVIHNRRVQLNKQHHNALYEPDGDETGEEDETYSGGENESGGETDDEDHDTDSGEDNSDYGDEADFEDELYEEEHNEQDDEVDNEEDNAVGEPPRKKTRGLTQLTKIHYRSMEDRDKVQLNEHGQPIGDDEICRTFSQFLGTLVRRSHFLPLTCPTWRHVHNDKKDEIWDYVNLKYIVPDKGKKWVLETVRDSWRLYKHRLKKWTYKKYPTHAERIANCPKWIPKSDFPKWLKYLRKKKVKAMSKKNSENRKNNIKYVPRTGRITFARIREKMREANEEKEYPNEIDMFKKTRRGKNPPDEATNSLLTQIEELETQGDNEQLNERFKEAMGVQQPGRVRGYGRSVTASRLKQLSNQKKMEDEMESYKKSLEDVFAQKLDHLTANFTRGLNQFVTVLQSSNPDMVVPTNFFANLFNKTFSPSDASSAQPPTPRSLDDLQLPSSGATNSPAMDNAHLGNFSPANGNGML